MLNRKDRRKKEKQNKKIRGNASLPLLNKQLADMLSDMPIEDKEKLFIAVEQDRVRRDNKVNELSVLAGMETAYILLFETYLAPIQADSDKDFTTQQVNALINHVSKEYLLAKAKREEQKVQRNE